MAAQRLFTWAFVASVQRLGTLREAPSLLVARASLHPATCFCEKERLLEFFTPPA
ncbi:hypothetical protein [Streptomyces goshikiensis]|uniref:hypothetical protein n=1 Tax=Streptomyces goshikiensis TaxID=1942 RepID=UPI0036582284